MNWGKGIVGGMILFMLFILSMCIYMFYLPADDYDHQYYEKGLAFDHDYNREAQVIKDHAKPMIVLSPDSMKIIFTRPAAGTITFMRPSNQYQDRIFKIDNNAGPQVRLPLQSIEKGQWRISITWESDHKAYLYNQEVYIK
jgi:hypothetical protein